MKRIIKLSVLAIVAITLGMTSCKKSDSLNDELDSGTDLKQLSVDESNTQNESEGVLNDVNGVMENSALGKTYNVYGAIIDDSSDIGHKRIFIHYGGDCKDGSRHRRGDAIVTLIEGAKWSDAGSVIKMEYVNLTSTRKANGKSVVFNGVFYVRNVSGGKVFVDATVVHKFWGHGTLNFDGETAMREWYVNRLRTFTNVSGVLNVKTEGDTTVNGNTNVMMWGTNRKSMEFYTLTTSPIIISSACTNGPISGVKVHKGLVKDVTVTFGVEESGVVVSSGCAYGLRVDWKNRKDEAKTAVIAY